MYMKRPNLRYSAARAVSVAAVAFVLGGCATKGDIRALQTEVRAELRSQSARQDTLIALLERESASTQDTLRTQADQLVDFRGDITRLLRSISDGMTRLEAIVGENQRGIASMRSQLASGAVAPRSTPGLGGDPELVPSGGAETVAGIGGRTDAGQLYEVARDQHLRGSLTAAQQAYEQFLEEFSNDERAPDAHFHLADLLTQQDRPDDALERFQEIPALYPAAVRVPEALFRIAGLQADMGDTEGARATLQRLINTYPEIGLASLARDMLEELE
jgi:TolA-binding protein